MEEIQYDKCPRCKTHRLPTQFLNEKGRKLKTCDVCRKRGRKNRENSKCTHNKVKYLCIICGGASLCIHNREKIRCKECGGSGICEHNKRKGECKECGGSQICKHYNLKYNCKECLGSQICKHIMKKNICKKCMTTEECILFIKKRMVHNSRNGDKKYERYDANNHIDLCFINGLFEDYVKCPYCDVDFTYEERCKTLITIERKDNSIGHTKANCILCCFSCNSRRVG
jgi:DNA-directed RNA polymerase subunit RPC12/RpoP